MDNIKMTADEELFMKAKDAYYEGNPIMSDSQFDILEEKLKRQGSSLISIVGTRKAGTIKHLSPMLSLSKVSVMDSKNMLQQIQEISAWIIEAISKGCKEFEAGGKYDGNAVGLIYKNGILVNALSRGDKTSGFDYIDKMKNLVPQTIVAKDTLEIRGEVVISVDIFDKKYSDKFKNARNFVTGLLSRDDTKHSMLADCTFVAYEIRIHGDDGDYSYPKNRTMDVLYALGFNKVHRPLIKYFTSAKEFVQIYHDFEKYRDSGSEFQMDGMVIKTDEACRLKIGSTDHHPKWAIAVKYPPKDAITEIISIDWKTGSTGEVVPTAVMKPLDLDGTTVQRATLFNRGKIDEMMAWPGAKVLVAKAGDIIPQIYKVITPSVISGKLPDTCPTCSSKLEDDGTHLWCRNDDCYAQALNKLQAGVQVMEFDFIGASTLKNLYSAGIKRIEDFFDKKKFNETYLIRSGYFKPGRELDRILESVNSVSSVPLTKVIQSMKLKDTGGAVSEQVGNFFSGVEYDFKGLNREAVEYLTNKSQAGYKRLMEFLALLRDNHIEVEFKEKVDTSLKIIEMTGDPPNLGTMKTKSDWFKYLRQYGYVQGKLDKNASALLTNSHSSNTSKMTRAKQLGIPIHTYEEFVERVIGDTNLLKSNTTTNSTPQDKGPQTNSLFG